MKKPLIASIVFIIFSVLLSAAFAEAQVVSESARIEQEARRVAQAISSYLRTRQPTKFELETLMRSHDVTVTNLLRARNYHISTVPMPETYKTILQDVEIPLYQINPDLQTNLGKFATELKRRYDVDVVYAPVLLEVIGGNGAFFEGPGRPFLLLTADAPVTDSLSNATNRHEAVHMKFWAFRKGFEPEFLPNAPVHITFQSLPPINPKPDVRYYQHSMTFEELVAFSENVKSRASILLADSNAQNQTFFQHEIVKFKDVTENALIAAGRSLQLLKQGHQAVPIPYPTKINGQHFSIENGDFKMVMFLPAHEAMACVNQCGRNLINKLEKAVLLAKFNQQFLQKFGKTAPDEATLKSAVGFQKAQIDFLLSL